MSSKFAEVIEAAKEMGFDISISEDIQVNGRYLQDITADALKALEEHNSPPKIFVRSGSLVRLVLKDRLVVEP